MGPSCVGLVSAWVTCDSVIWLVLFTILRLRFLMPGVVRVQLIFVVGNVSGVVDCWIFLALCGCLVLIMSGRGTRLCFGVFWLGGVWNGFLLSRVKGQLVPCRFFGSPDGDGHLFWECTLPLLVEIRENPEFHDLVRMDKGHWPRCLLWHGWLPMLSGVNGASR